MDRTLDALIASLLSVESVSSVPSAAAAPNSPLLSPPPPPQYPAGKLTPEQLHESTRLRNAYQRALAEHGRQLWTMLHEWAHAYPCEPTAADVRAAREWLARWEASVPTFGCKCRREWARITARCPIPLESGRDAVYWWTIAAHDAINRTLGRPLAAPAWSQNHPLLKRSPA